MFIANKIGNVYLIKNTAYSLLGIYKKKKHFKDALAMHELFVEMRDSINSIENKEAAIKLQYQHEYEKKEQQRVFDEKEAKRIVKEKQLALEAAKTRLNNLQYTSIFIFLILLSLVIVGSAKLKLPIKLINGAIFFNFLLFFEFIIILVDPLVAKYITNAPVFY